MLAPTQTPASGLFRDDFPAKVAAAFQDGVLAISITIADVHHSLHDADPPTVILVAALFTWALFLPYILAEMQRSSASTSWEEENCGEVAQRSRTVAGREASTSTSTSSTRPYYAYQTPAAGTSIAGAPARRQEHRCSISGVLSRRNVLDLIPPAAGAVSASSASPPVCVVCLDNTPTVLFLRCRHLCLCAQCDAEYEERGVVEAESAVFDGDGHQTAEPPPFVQVQRCPICREAGERITVFHS
mmetsp:Transcript_4900/g.12186  ORF Transcript_4900/g.12186 Transcript_4900/m.12186 type:complete len:244 (-) Transcript_4900:391-1122(-)